MELSTAQQNLEAIVRKEERRQEKEQEGSDELDKG